MTNRHIDHPVRELVQEVLSRIHTPWPPNITDLVCSNIEKNRAWQNQYDRLVAQYGKHGVNSQIGRSTLALTGLRNLGERERATSKLIKTFTRLG